MKFHGLIIFMFALGAWFFYNYCPFDIISSILYYSLIGLYALLIISTSFFYILEWFLYRILEIKQANEYSLACLERRHELGI